MPTSHQVKWNDLKKVPGLKSKLSGHYKDTPANKAYITRLHNKFAEVIKNPKLFQPVIAKSKSTKKAIPLGEGNVRFIPKAEHQTAFVREGRVYRRQRDTLGLYASGRPKGFIDKTYRQVIGPGEDPIPKLLELLARGEKFDGKLYGQIKGRPFLMNRIEGRGDENPIRGAVNYLNNWMPSDGRMSTRDMLLDQMSVLTTRVVRHPDEPMPEKPKKKRKARGKKKRK